MKNLAQLRAERDAAKARLAESIAGAREQSRALDAAALDLAREHPVAALGTAAAIGAAAGLLLAGRPVRRLAAAAGMALLRPAISVAVSRLASIPDEADSDSL